MGRLDGKVAIITGAGSGMGQAAAKLFAREGARVVAADVNASDGEAVVAEIRQAGGEAVFVKTDVSRAEDCQRMVAAAVETYGKLNILVNNAGIWMRRKPDLMTEDEWDRVIDVNLKGVWLGCKYAIPELRKAGGGAIVSTASAAGKTGSPNNVAYGASKGGVIALTKSLALYLAKQNIRVNCVCPGPTQSHFFDPLGPEGAVAAYEASNRYVPMARSGKPHEIANAMLFLASDEASYVTGEDFAVDGGMLAM